MQQLGFHNVYIFHRKTHPLTFANGQLANGAAEASGFRSTVALVIGHTYRYLQPSSFVPPANFWWESHTQWCQSASGSE